MSRRREILVGLVVVLGIALGVFGTLWLQGISVARTTVLVDASFEDVGQLMDGNSVKYRGVSIGRVSSITVDSSGMSVRVVMRIASDVEFPQQAGAVASPESMFGDWQVDIVDMQDERSRIYDWYMGQPDALPGYALPDMSELTQQAQVIADNVTDIMERVEIAFTEETAQNVAALIDNIEGVSEQIAILVDQQADDFTEMTAELRVAANQVGNAAGAVEATFSRMDTLLGGENVDSLVTDLQTVASNMREASLEMTNTAQSLQSTLSRADTTFAHLNRIAARIEAGEGGFGRLLSDTSLVLRAEGALAQLNFLLEDLRENPNRYFRLSIF